MNNVGADIEGICGKCGDVWHVVVAKVGDRIAKVQCKQCGALHRHRAPGAKATAVRRKPATTARRATAKEPPQLVEGDPSRPPRPYRPSETYVPGERIDHGSFGRGIVQQVIGSNKIAVHFPDRPRTLVQGHLLESFSERG